MLEASIQETQNKYQKILKNNQDLETQNLIITEKLTEDLDSNEKLLKDTQTVQEENEMLKEENKMEILKNTNKNILSTRNEINMWKKCIDDKNQLIQDLKNKIKKKDEENEKFKNEVPKAKTSGTPEVAEIKHLNQVIFLKEKELKDLKEKGQEYYTQADESLKSQRREIEIFTKRCVSLQGEVKRLKEELRASDKDRDIMREDIKKMKSGEFKGVRENEELKRLVYQLREEKNKLLQELSKEVDNNSQKFKFNEKFRQEIGSLRLQSERSGLKNNGANLQKELDRKSEEVNNLTENLTKITDCVFGLPQVNIHPEDSNIIDSTIKAIKGLSEQLAHKESLKNRKDSDSANPESSFKSQLAQYYSLVNRSHKSPAKK